jgi:transmembrane sensor
MDTPEDREQIRTEAAEWFLREQSPLPGLAEQQAFTEWLTRSPTHIEEYLAVSSAWGALDVPNEGDFSSDALIAAARGGRELDNVVRLVDRLPSQSSGLVYGAVTPPPEPPTGREDPPRWVSRRAVAALAACLLLGVVVWKGYLGRPSGTVFETAVGEQRSETLRDGSVVFLNTNSTVHVQWLGSERRVELTRGEARFRVAKNVTQPFVVLTSRAAVRVLGTEFNVRADTKSTQVAVMEGQVEVLATNAATSSTPAMDPVGSNVDDDSHPTPVSSASIRLGAGERAAVTNQGIEPNTGPSIESVVAWTDRRLVFRDEPLNSVVSEFNRYRTRPLVLDDPELAALKISGAFDLSDPESLLAYLQTFETVQVRQLGDGSEHLSR